MSKFIIHMNRSSYETTIQVIEELEADGIRFGGSGRRPTEYNPYTDKIDIPLNALIVEGTALYRSYGYNRYKAKNGYAEIDALDYLEKRHREDISFCVDEFLHLIDGGD